MLLFDARNYHLFTPLLYQVATALLGPSDIAYPFRTIFRRSKNLRFRQAQVTEVDFEAQRVHTATGDDIAYDTLVLAPGSARIVLVEGADRLLSAFHPRLGAYATETLRGRGVEVRLSTLVREATATKATTSSGETIGSRTIVWSAGVKATDPLPPDDTGVVVRSRSRRLAVDGQLRLRPQVYAIGDVASVAPGPHQEGELPMLSPPAMQEGRYVARMIRAGEAAVAGQPPFRYRDKGTMATIGRRAAVAQVGPLRLRGFLGWITWLAVHLYYLIGFRNRLVVLGSWSWDYLRRDRPIRLIVRSGYDPVVATLIPER